MTIQGNATILVHRWLSDPEWGVEAAVAIVPRHRMDKPDFAAPVMPPIFNDIENEELAGNNDLDPNTDRALIVYCDGPALTVPNASRTASLPGRLVKVTIAWVTRERPVLEAVNDGEVLLRATDIAMKKLNHQVASKGYRELNGVKIAKVNEVETFAVKGAVGRSRLWGFVQANLTVIDSLTG